MNHFISLLRGLAFLVIGGMVSSCLTKFETVQESNFNGKIENYPPLKTLPLENGYTAKALHFLLDNEHVMAIQGYRGAFFIDLNTEKILHSYLFQEEDIASEQIFHQDQYLLLQGRGAADLWEIASGKRLQSWRDPDTNAQATAVSQSGKTLFTAQDIRQLSGESTSWEKGPVRTLFSVNAHAILSAATISPNKDYLATGGTWDNYATLWDLHTGRRVISWWMQQHVRTLSFSTNNQYLYVGTYTKLVTYEVATQQKVSEISHPVSSGAEYLGSQNAILIVSDEGEIQLSRAPSGEQLWSYQAGQEVSDWNHYPRSDLLAVRLSNGEIVILELKSGQVRLRFQSPFQVMGPLDVSKDGKFLAMMGVSEKGWEVAVWQLPEKGNLGK